MSQCWGLCKRGKAGSQGCQALLRGPLHMKKDNCSVSYFLDYEEFNTDENKLSFISIHTGICKFIESKFTCLTNPVYVQALRQVNQEFPDRTNLN